MWTTTSIEIISKEITILEKVKEIHM
jgi:hypothetical protein